MCLFYRIHQLRSLRSEIDRKSDRTSLFLAQLLASLLGLESSPSLVHEVEAPHKHASSQDKGMSGHDEIIKRRSDDEED